MDNLAPALVLIIVVQAIVIVVLLGCCWVLRQRPQWKVYKKQELELEKVRRDLDGKTRAFDAYRASNGSERYILDIKEAIDADDAMILISNIIINGAGAAGDVTNVQALVEAVYGEVPEKINKVWYQHDTKIAVWQKGSRVPNALNKLLPKD